MSVYEMQKITAETKVKQLTGHVSPETAFVIEDYPHGFTLRCKKRYWIESSKFGQRLVTQTSNPRRNNETWNAPKKSTYDLFDVLIQVDDPSHERNGHVLCYGVSGYAEPEKKLDFLKKWKLEHVLPEKQAEMIRRLESFIEQKKLNDAARQFVGPQPQA